ncbi:Hypothetical protein FKW44_012175, partial [Caligus rogercresseyi]
TIKIQGFREDCKKVRQRVVSIRPKKTGQEEMTQYRKENNGAWKMTQIFVECHTLLC